MKILENKVARAFGQKKCPFCSCVFLVEPEDKEKIKHKLGMNGVVYYIFCPRCGAEVFLTNDKKKIKIF